ncbi:MAG: hypothetical protein ACREB9_08710 [Thermoplasmata archaeon]
MPVFRIQRRECVYIEAANEEEADDVYGLLFDAEEVGFGAQDGRLGGEVSVRVVTSRPPDFRAARDPDFPDELGYEDADANPAPPALRPGKRGS